MSLATPVAETVAVLQYNPLIATPDAVYSQVSPTSSSPLPFVSPET